MSALPTIEALSEAEAFSAVHERTQLLRRSVALVEEIVTLARGWSAGRP